MSERHATACAGLPGKRCIFRIGSAGDSKI